MQIPPMLINKEPIEKDVNLALSSGNYVGQEKLDGYFYMMEKTDDGNIYLFSRSSKDCTRIMGCLPKNAIARQENEGFIHYYIHDCLRFDGKMVLDNPYLSRYNVLQESKLFNNYIATPEIELAITYYKKFLVGVERGWSSRKRTLHIWRESGQEIIGKSRVKQLLM